MKKVILGFTFAVTFLVLAPAMGQVSQPPVDLTQIAPTTSIPVTGTAPGVVAAPAATSPAPATTTQAPDQDPIPQWAKNLLVKIQSFPKIGPIVATILAWLPLFYGMMTALGGFLIAMGGIITAGMKMKAQDPSKVAQYEANLQAFLNSKFMYYVKYLSFMNAQKPPSA